MTQQQAFARGRAPLQPEQFIAKQTARYVRSSAGAIQLMPPHCHTFAAFRIDPFRTRQNAAPTGPALPPGLISHILQNLITTA